MIGMREFINIKTVWIGSSKAPKRVTDSEYSR